MKFEIKNRFTRDVQFTVELEAPFKSEPYSIQLGAAVKLAVKKDANLGDANLGGANLRDANLGDANLADANLGDANLRGANLGGANLGGANLGGANLGGANLGGANLRDAYLADAYLADANLGDANLGDAYLRGAYLRGAYLGGANLGDANLRGANLGGANLGGANLGGANLRGAKDVPAHVLAETSIVPEVGAFDAFKKADGAIVSLRIPASAKRSNATGRKCRASKAKVLSISDGRKEVTSARGGVYRVGEVIECHRWCEDRWEECAGGIHFFITRAEAEAW